MTIEELIRRKGDFVATVRPDATVAEALAELADHGIGALVVSSDGTGVEGIVSERDVVRRLHDQGAAVLQGTVADIMSTAVRTCSPTSTVDSLMETMTTHRIRHVPVVRDGALIGIVSIGDVVKTRMDELEADRRALEDYISAR